ncbi:MAG: tRNA lysidine(34) synthetase TilS [Filimonas sp.]|nr:tRNA lysidine(34) synthetase TilS [Filimonas sp.]
MSHTLLHRFTEHVRVTFPQLQPAQAQLLLAVSGGIDSVAMVDLFAKAGYRFVIAHCNFQLRGAESERDEAFVRSLGDKYGCEVLVQKFDTADYATANKLSIQEAARTLRYNWFKEVLTAQLPNGLIATAHHGDDNIETLLMHFFRGTGIQGLTAIPAYNKDAKVIRPLLFAFREEIQAYVNNNSLQWVEDSSNASDKYARNFFRNKLIPAITEIYPQAKDNLLQNIERYKEVATLYVQSIALHKKKLIVNKGQEVHVPVLKLKKAVPLHTIAWEIIKPYNFSAAQTEELVKLLDAANGSYITSATHRIILNRNWLIITPLQHEEATNVLIETAQRTSFAKGRIDFELIAADKFHLSKDAAIASFDAAKIKFPLLLRKWKQGDYFYPLGMQKKKKLSKFFIDQKLSVIDKENVWVLEMDKKIIWVVGHRIDDRFKVGEDTKEVLNLKVVLGTA